MAQQLCSWHSSEHEEPELGRLHIWLPELVERFASFLHPNEVPFGLRLVNKATAAAFRGRPQFTTVRLSQPVPPHAFARRWGIAGAVRSLTIKQRHRLLCLTAASGSVPNLEVALARVGLVLTASVLTRLLEAAAAAGQAQMCEWLLAKQGLDLDGDDASAAATAAAEAAAEAGQRTLCQLLVTSRGAVCKTGVLRAAARGGHSDLLDWLLLRCPYGPFGPEDRLKMLGVSDCYRLLTDAAAGCDLRTLQRLNRRSLGLGEAGGWVQEGEGLYLDMWRNMLPKIMFCVMAAAAGSRTPDWPAKLEWLESLGVAREEYPWQQRCCAAAAACPDAASRLRALRQRGYAVDGMALSAAAEAGNTAALEFLLAEGVDWDPFAGAAAAGAGHLSVLTTLHDGGYPLGAGDVARKAAAHGHLSVLVWAVEALGAEVQGERVLGEAAKSGSVEVMAWVRQRGGSWSGAALGDVAGSGCEEAMEWAVEQGCPVPTDGRPYVCVARNGDRAALRCLKRLGCPWGSVGHVFAECVSGGLPQSTLQWLIQEGCPVDWPMAVAAVRYPGDKVKDWLKEQQRLSLSPVQPEP